jgi:phosphoribosylformylglycinamidine synthase subunit PurQ / glutaminase
VSVRALVLRSAGTNCDEETSAALKAAGAEPDRVHINRFIAGDKSFSDYGLLVIPGGFSYGDDVASGKVFANRLLYRLREPLQEFMDRKKPILGICNGFQVLVKCGLLPGLEGGWDDPLTATLTTNDSGKFECRWTFLSVGGSRRCVFLRGLPDVFPLPVAHGEGKFVPASDTVYRALAKNGQIVLRYADARGHRAGYPWNPNGSYDGVAGICNASGNVMGLMPHPERYSFTHQHSHWTRLKPLPPQGVGLQIFKNAVRYAAQLKP